MRPGTDTVSGEMRIGLPLNFSKSVFVPIMQKFQADYPRVQFHLTIAETTRLLQQVATFELDFAITDDSVPAEFLPKMAMKEVF